jgi:hypothetical protein
MYGNDDKGTVTQLYFVDDTRRNKQSKVGQIKINER